MSIFSHPVTKWVTVLSVSASLLSACSQTPAKPEASKTPTPTTAPDSKPAPAVAVASPSQQAVLDAFKTISTEMDKVGEAKADYSLVQKLYTEQFKATVQKQDNENKETSDTSILAAIEGGRDGKLKSEAAGEIVKKLIQKSIYLSMKDSLKAVNTNWAQPEQAKKSLEEAKQWYKAVLESSVKKRDEALKLTLNDTINGAFGQMDKTIGSPTSLEFDLARQVVDKTIMKNFYLAIAEKDYGYVYKAEKAIAEGKDGKKEQAEGWALYQSVRKYVESSAPEESALINKQLELSTDLTTVKAETVHGALVRGFAKIALHEYDESIKEWGKDKAVVTGLEGAIFIDLLSRDLIRLSDEATYNTLKQATDRYIQLAKNKGSQEEATALIADITKQLNAIVVKTTG